MSRLARSLRGKHPVEGVPEGARVSLLRHRVAFYETDAMGVVHHTNYVRYFENARVVWLEEHDRPYQEYVARGLHFAVTRIEVDYRRSARFGDWLRVLTWLDWARGASLRMAYRIERTEGIEREEGVEREPGQDADRPELLVEGASEHAAVDLEGRIRRIPRERRESLQARALRPPRPTD